MQISTPHIRAIERRFGRIVLALLVSSGPLLVAAPTQASPVLGILDYQGFAYESIPFGAAGSVLSGVGTVDTWFFPVNDPSKHYTWRMTDLVSLGAVPIGGGTTYTQYTGGTFAIFEDAANNYVYDLLPGNGQADPGGFEDGTLWLLGQFASFDYFWNAPAGLGAYSGDILITGGTVASYFGQGSAFTFGGTTDQTSLPEGYALKVDGAVEGPLVPEPASVLLLGAPLAGWAVSRLRSRNRRG